jgi:NADH-quinone oxidoreductase subunit C
MRIEELRDHICAIYPDLCPLLSVEFGDGNLSVPLERLHSAAEDLLSIGFTRLGMVTAVDHGDRFEMVYRLKSASLQAAIFLKCDVERAEPRVPSMCDLWPGANWQEREVYDLFGIVFENHPDLRRIVLPDEWVGHPLRKDYEDDRIIRRPDYI